MSEAGLSAAEVGKEIAEHLEKSREHEPEGRGRRITIIEAILLASVALLAAWSGFAAAKWSTESRLELAQSTQAPHRGERGRPAGDGGPQLRRPHLQRLVQRLPDR